MTRPITNTPYIVIDHERYGACTKFDSLKEAVESIRSMGDEFKNVALEIHGPYVINEHNDVVGYVTH